MRSDSVERKRIKFCENLKEKNTEIMKLRASVICLEAD